MFHPFLLFSVFYFHFLTFYTLHDITVHNLMPPSFRVEYRAYSNIHISYVSRSRVYICIDYTPLSARVSDYEQVAVITHSHLLLYSAHHTMIPYAVIYSTLIHSKPHQHCCNHPYRLFPFFYTRSHQYRVHYVLDIAKALSFIYP